MNVLTTVFTVLATVFLFSNSAPAEEYYEENDGNYREQESYQEEQYQEESYPEDTYVEESYREESFQEPAPEMDSYQANMVKEARTNCQQWAQESGLEGEDKTTFIEDCVYSQTGL